MTMPGALWWSLGGVLLCMCVCECVCMCVCVCVGVDTPVVRTMATWLEDAGGWGMSV